MYVRIEGDEALVIDPQSSVDALVDLRRAGVNRVLVLLTHEHFDHTSGVNFFRRHFASAKVMAHEETARCILKARNNRPLALLKMVTAENREKVMAAYHSYAVEPIAVDDTAADGEQLVWQGHAIRVTAVPGHSPGSILLSFDRQAVFTGDYMIPDAEVILRYPGGSEQAYREIALPRLQALPEGIAILPGHGVPYGLVR